MNGTKICQMLIHVTVIVAATLQFKRYPLSSFNFEFITKLNTVVIKL